MLSICSFIQSCTFGKKPVDLKKSTSYYKKRGGIYYSPKGNWVAHGYSKCNADSKSFVVLSEEIGRDKESIYYKGKLQNNVDYPTFRVDQNGIPKDKNHVYTQTYANGLKPIPIPAIDVESFQYLKKNAQAYPRWAKDKNWYYLGYYLGYIKLNTDYETTNIIGSDFLYDKTRLYIHFNKPPFIKLVQEIIEPPKKLTEKYIQYKSKLYYLKTFDKKENEVKKISYQSIKVDRVVNNHVIIINDTVVYYGETIPYFDAATLEKIKDNELSEHVRYYKDKNFVYIDAKIIKQAKPKTFTMLCYSFAKDDKHVFYKEKILTGADPNSFRKDKNQEWVDNNGNRFDSKGKKIISVKNRAMNLNKTFKFKEAKNTACFVCSHVLNKERSILYASHSYMGDVYVDFSSGQADTSWQFLCGENNHTDDTIQIISLEQVTKIDPTINDLHALALGFYAQRKEIGKRWELAYLEGSEKIAIITSQVLGQMQQSTEFEEYWAAEPQKLPWFNGQEVSIQYTNFNPNEDLDFLKEADEVAKNILAMTTSDRLLTSKHVYQSYLDYLEDGGADEEPRENIKKPEEIWHFIELESITIKEQNDTVYAMFELICHWGDETDYVYEYIFQMVFNNQAKLTRVSAADGEIDGEGMITL